MTELDVDQKVTLMRLVMDLRQSAPIGVVGLLESRDLFAVLFPEFGEIRDADLDNMIKNYADSLSVKDSPDLQV